MLPDVAGLRVGDAQVSEQHCNFLINHGVATAARFGNAGRGPCVHACSRHIRVFTLHWEIKRMGEARA